MERDWGCCLNQAVLPELQRFRKVSLISATIGWMDHFRLLGARSYSI